MYLLYCSGANQLLFFCKKSTDKNTTTTAKKEFSTHWANVSEEKREILQKQEPNVNQMIHICDFSCSNCFCFSVHLILV